MSVAMLPKGYDVEQAILSLVPMDIQNKDIEAGYGRMVQLKVSMRKFLPKLKREDWESISAGERSEIKELLWLYWNNEELGSKFKDSPVCAETILKLMINTTMKFPVKIQQIASIMLDIHESNNWGIPSKVEEKAEPSNSKKRKRDTEKSEEKKVTPLATYTRAPSNHPIFGTTGIMHHIQVSKGGPTTSYRVDPNYTKKAFNVFGDNGIQIGEVWANQIAALRDGAHGSRVAGISGNITDGVYSIVVTGKYANIDIDSGDIIYYSVPNATKITDKIADYEADAPKKLLRSQATKKSIRVLRKYDSKWEGAPNAGLRYDGLYKITSSEERSNDLGGKFLRFRLKRCSGQAAIDKARPTRQERRQFEDMKLGY